MNIVDYIQAFYYFVEVGVIVVQVSGVVVVVVNEELRIFGVLFGVCYRQYVMVVVLIVVIKFIIDGIIGAVMAIVIWVFVLNDEVGNNVVESQAIVVVIFGQFYKVSNGIWGIFVIEFDFYGVFFGFDFCFGYGNCF